LRVHYHMKSSRFIYSLSANLFRIIKFHYHPLPQTKRRKTFQTQLLYIIWNNSILPTSSSKLCSCYFRHRNQLSCNTHFGVVIGFTSEIRDGNKNGIRIGISRMRDERCTRYFIFNSDTIRITRSPLRISIQPNKVQCGTFMFAFCDLLFI
jgi:hypothetical protein